MISPYAVVCAQLRDLDASVAFEPVVAPHTYAADAAAKRQAHYVRMAGEVEVVSANLSTPPRERRAPTQ